MGVDFGPVEEATSKNPNDDALETIEAGIETKKEKTRKKMIAENRAILSLIQQPNEDGKNWLEQEEGCNFTCLQCETSIATFSRICDHMNNSHPLNPALNENKDIESPLAVNQCIACPKRFKKKTHLKVGDGESITRIEMS